jgi:hypothetical protein
MAPFRGIVESMKNDNEDPVNARPKADTRWKPGQSGNPKGMKRGSRHRASLLAESLLDGETDRITRRCIYEAIRGDTVALRLCLERLLPPVRSRPISFKLPALRTTSDALSAISSIVEGVSRGALLAEEAQALTDMVGVFIKALEVTALEDRLVALEQASAGAPGARFDA